MSSSPQTMTPTLIIHVYNKLHMLLLSVVSPGYNSEEGTDIYLLLGSSHGEHKSRHIHDLMINIMRS